MALLIIEDDPEIALLIQTGLEQNGFEIQHVVSAEEGLERAQQKQFQLIITDLMLPGLDGLDMISHLRQKKINTPVLILSAKRSLDDRVKGLQAGGDDYMVKPFAFVELLARVNSLLRRATTEQTISNLEFEDIRMDLIKREVFRSNKKIELQTKEFQLLELFIKNKNLPLSKTQILEKIWGYHFDPQANVVDVLVYRLRNKIDKDFAIPYLQTIRGIGYVFKVE